MTTIEAASKPQITHDEHSGDDEPKRAHRPDTREEYAPLRSSAGLESQ